MNTDNNKKSSNKKKSLIILLILACIIGGALIVDEVQRQRRIKAYQEMQQRRQNNPYNSYQPSFGGRAEDRYEYGNRTCTYGNCDCKVLRSSFKSGDDICPKCHHKAKYHNTK